MNDDTTVSYDQIKGAIGSLLMLWSDIERTLAESLDRLQVESSSKQAHGIARKIELWSGQIKPHVESRELASRLFDELVEHLGDALSVRNLVTHGLTGIAAKNRPDGDDAHLTVELGGIRRTLTWTELQEMFRWMCEVRWLIRSLTNAALKADDLQAEERLLAWRNFRHQS